MKNYLWNMLIKIQNGQIAKRSFVLQEKRKNCERFLKILWKHGFILGFQNSLRNSKKLKIFLRFKDNKSVLNKIKIISKPSRQIYYSNTEFWKIPSKAFIVLSTIKGLQSVYFCKRFKIGGKALILID